MPNYPSPFPLPPSPSRVQSPSWRSVSDAQGERRDDDAARKVASGPRRCASCGQFVSNRHLKTARYFYDIDWSKPVSVYSLATATVLQERLDCAGCSMQCCRMEEAGRDHGVAVGRQFPHGWIKCTPESTQDNLVEVSA